VDGAEVDGGEVDSVKVVEVVGGGIIELAKFLLSTGVVLEGVCVVRGRLVGRYVAHSAGIFVAC
jgi:hypothetical protein